MSILETGGKVTARAGFAAAVSFVGGKGLEMLGEATNQGWLKKAGEVMSDSKTVAFAAAGGAAHQGLKEMNHQGRVGGQEMAQGAQR